MFSEFIQLTIAGLAVGSIYALIALDAAKAFTKRYVAKYNSQPDVFGGWVYDAMNVLSRVIAKDGTAPAAIQKGIRAVKGYHGVEGTYTFDTNGDGLHGYWVVKIKHRKVIPIKYVG